MARREELTHILADVGVAIEHTLATGGIELPCSVHVLPHPSPSFDLRARMVDGGALILVNDGFLKLLSEIVRLMNATVQAATFKPDGSIVHHTPPADFDRKTDASYRALASAVLAYVDARAQWRPGTQSLDEDWRLVAASHQASAILHFAIAHEFGHLLAGHLEEPGPRTAKQELEADQLGGLIVLSAMETADHWPENFFVAAGPFLFLAIHHLIRRVRNEIDGIPQGFTYGAHPPSDHRAAALRDMFVAAHGPSILHIADSGVYWLAEREDSIVEQAAELRPAD